MFVARLNLQSSAKAAVADILKLQLGLAAVWAFGATASEVRLADHHARSKQPLVLLEPGFGGQDAFGCLRL